jgi:cation transport protein ChaC
MDLPRSDSEFLPADAFSAPPSTVPANFALEFDWVFGYGSLIWDPGFNHTETSLARVHGWHRAFCIHSTLYRGTTDAPGIVLGLDRGGCVDGVVFRLDPTTRRTAIDYLYAREMPNRVYQARVVEARLIDGRVARALTFVADRHSASYVRLTEDEVVRRLLCCCGERGPNRDYAINTWEALARLGVHDDGLGSLVARLKRHEALDRTGSDVAHPGG